MHGHLREATAAFHRRVETQLDLLDPELTLERYRRILEAFFGYYAPLEHALASASASASATASPRGFALAARTPRIERDLVTLGISRQQVAALPRCMTLPPLNGAAGVAGCLYVVEGASLGGRVISRALRRRLGLHADNGASFFAGEGDATAARWKAVLAWIEEVGATLHCGNAIVATACKTFDTLEQWFRARDA